MTDLERGKQHSEITIEINATEMGRSAIRGAESLNAKTSALLSHVSIMVGISTILLFQSGREDGHFDAMVLFELIAYLLICLLCLSAVWVSSAASYKKRKTSYLDTLIVITTKRRARYKLALVSTIVVTALLIFNVILSAFDIHIWVDANAAKAEVQRLIPEMIKA